MSQADPEHYREQAKRARAKADAATSPNLRQQWLDVVQQYEALANHAEKQTRKAQ